MISVGTVLSKIGSTLVERMVRGEVDAWGHPEGNSAVAVAAGCRKALVNARWAIFCFLPQTGPEMLLIPCRGSISDSS